MCVCACVRRAVCDGAECTDGCRQDEAMSLHFAFVMPTGSTWRRELRGQGHSCGLLPTSRRASDSGGSDDSSGPRWAAAGLGNQVARQRATCLGCLRHGGKISISRALGQPGSQLAEIAGPPLASSCWPIITQDHHETLKMGVTWLCQSYRSIDFSISHIHSCSPPPPSLCLTVASVISRYTLFQRALPLQLN
ncbi:unnamed protein product [Protopolystoma xenopodis]|uniref:Uncharacterized protein n=1 Tax=Protopolystoma xenopodis TaxID=117903 RepID=A0A448XQ75_9PLAT|nr:unnamed protein product [Protopolystoma xenopodis]